MFRKLLPVAVATVLALGCKREVAEDAPVAPAGELEPVGDPNATYTIIVGDDEATDKLKGSYKVVRTLDSMFRGKKEAGTETKCFEYVDQVLERGPNGRVTKLTRTFTEAYKTDRTTGQRKDYTFANKVVTITRTGPNPGYSINGRPVADAAEMPGELTRTSKEKLGPLMPPGPVKVGERWTPADGLKHMFSRVRFPYDASKSRVTGQLRRVYTQDGRQWAAIMVETTLTLDPAPQPDPKWIGEFRSESTVHMPIDGAERLGRTIVTVKGDFVLRDSKGPDGRARLEETQEWTLKAIK